jgi:DNA-directed RNA polymerase I, II, and III subunit RPABC2
MNVVTDFFGITNSKEDENESVNDTSVESSLEKQESIDEDDNDTLLAKDTDEDDENNDDGEDDNDALDDEEEEGDDDSDEDDEDDEDDDDDSDDEDLQKLQGYEEKNVLVDYHPEVVQISEEELQTYSKVVRDNNGKIVDPFHKTIPIMTKYEKAKVIGIRAQQINSGSEPFIPVDVNMIDGLSIANQELLEKKIPFIIRRPMPNGSSEYWNINDLELLE